MIELCDVFYVAGEVDGHDMTSPHVGEPEAVFMPAGSLTEEESVEENGGF
jgi:hypothetical protein